MHAKLFRSGKTQSSARLVGKLRTTIARAVDLLKTGTNFFVFVICHGALTREGFTDIICGEHEKDAVMLEPEVLKTVAPLFAKLRTCTVRYDVRLLMSICRIGAKVTKQEQDQCGHLNIFFVPICCRAQSRNPSSWAGVERDAVLLKFEGSGSRWHTCLVAIRAASSPNCHVASVCQKRGRGFKNDKHQQIFKHQTLMPHFLGVRRSGFS